MISKIRCYEKEANHSNRRFAHAQPGTMTCPIVKLEMYDSSVLFN